MLALSAATSASADGSVVERPLIRVRVDRNGIPRIDLQSVAASRQRLVRRLAKLS